VLAQRHVDALRAGRRTGSLDDGDAAAIRGSVPIGPAMTAKACDPDRVRLLPRLQQAVSRSLAELVPSDRLLLALYYVEELTLAQIARLRGMHEATASRHLERIRRELREAVERALREGQPVRNGCGALPALSPAEVQLCFGYALEDWSFDLRKALPDDADRTRWEKY
jgi:DNA-directed RNA polymerase specialized sigma24 family protein